MNSIRRTPNPSPIQLYPCHYWPFLFLFIFCFLNRWLVVIINYNSSGTYHCAYKYIRFGWQISKEEERQRGGDTAINHSIIIDPWTLYYWRSCHSHTHSCPRFHLLDKSCLLPLARSPIYSIRSPTLPRTGRKSREFCFTSLPANFNGEDRQTDREWVRVIRADNPKRHTCVQSNKGVLYQRFQWNRSR